jgi:hypothetical protein
MSGGGSRFTVFRLLPFVYVNPRLEERARLELATYGTWPGTHLAGTAMMRKLERDNDDHYDDEAEAEAALYP